MLRLLRINNFALIDHLEIEFSSGLNILTGETGSGKSIILGALGLVLGDRASTDSIRSGTTACQVEALFSLEDDKELRARLQSYGLDQNTEEIIIRREINTQGKSKIYINDTLAAVSTLKTLGALLIDIYGQGEYQRLLRLDEQRRFLDEFAGNEPLLDEIGSHYQKVKEAAHKRKLLLGNEQDRYKQIDLLQFQRDEIEKVAPKTGEDQELENNRKILSNASKLNELTQRCYGFIHDNDYNLIGLLKQATDGLHQLQNIDGRLTATHEQMNHVRFTIQEAAYFLRDYMEGIEFDPQKLELIEDRIHLIERLKRKYGPTIEDILKYQTGIQEELKALESYEENEKLIEEELAACLAQYLKTGEKLTASRDQASSRLEKKLEKELKELAMEKVRFQVVMKTDLLEPVHADAERITQHGLDRIDFHVAVNPGEALKALNKTASGGELSRIMLALKCLSSGDSDSSTLIFDEVDTGIGGNVALLVGKKLKTASRNHQVICVTHMPQIASFSNRHFRVFKEERNGRAITRIELLEGENRIEEIARMLSGDQLSTISKKHAMELIKQNA